MADLYRGRFAPSPTGLLHAGHAATFLTAQHRARIHNGRTLYRSDDLDRDRCKPEFHLAALEDMRWLGLFWQEGPEIGGPHSPYSQSARLPLYQAALDSLRKSGWIYPCICSRREVASAVSAPHALDEEPFYPQHCRPDETTVFEENLLANWRFRIPNLETLTFRDSRLGPQSAVAGRDFGDFLVWRKDGVPSYQLSCAVDDALMHITEVVRGEDLIASTFRQILLLRALGYGAPAYYHCALMLDESGKRLAKRDASLAIRHLRKQGFSPEDLRALISKRLSEAP